MKLLLIEDDLLLGRAVSRALDQAGFEVCWVRMVRDAVAMLDTEPFAAVLLDLGLPDGSGLEYLKSARSRGDKTPILILTARDALEDKLAGLDGGADDYLVKPFAVPELISRIRALTRRSGGFATQIWTVGALSLDPVNQRAHLSGKLLSLSPREFKILSELMRSAGQVVRKGRLNDLVFGAAEGGAESNALEVHIHNLRRKLGAEMIQTVRGVGYLLDKVDLA